MVESGKEEEKVRGTRTCRTPQKARDKCCRPYPGTPAAILGVARLKFSFLNPVALQVFEKSFCEIVVKVLFEEFENQQDRIFLNQLCQTVQRGGRHARWPVVQEAYNIFLQATRTAVSFDRFSI